MPAAGSLPPVATYGLTIDSNAQRPLRGNARPRCLEAEPAVEVGFVNGRDRLNSIPPIFLVSCRCP